MNASKLLMACGVAVTMLVSSACAATGTQRSTGETIDDTALAARVKSALIQSDKTKARDIEVEVYRGEVQLLGFVTTPQEKADAAKLVQQVAGVKQVHNGLQVQPEDRSVGKAMDDAMITAKVKAALVKDGRTKAHQIEVNTNQGEVQLGGFVDSSQAKSAATSVAASVEGVKSVRNELEIRS